MRFPSSAFDSSGNFLNTWTTHLTNFFADLTAFGITKITPQPAWDDYGASLSAPTCAAYLSTAPGCSVPSPPPCNVNGQAGKYLRFSPLLPYGIDPNDNGYPDRTGGNQAYYCSPANPGFWGWSKHQTLVDNFAAAAQSKGLSIEEFDIENEVQLADFTVQARLIYDNITMTPVFQQFGQKLAAHGYPASVATVDVDTDSPGNLTPAPPLTYPCASVYGDAAQVLGSSELLAATGGAKIGFPPYILANGSLACDNSAGCAPYPACVTNGMINLPSPQETPTVTDMHAKPCLAPNQSCDLNADATIVARDTFTAVQNFIHYRNLTGNLVMFGETWSNSNEACNGYPDAALTQQTVAGYLQSCLYSSGNSGCTWAATPANVVFRPWGSVEWGGSPCETPLNVGAPNGPFKQ